MFLRRESYNLYKEKVNIRRHVIWFTEVWSLDTIALIWKLKVISIYNKHSTWSNQ